MICLFCINQNEIAFLFTKQSMTLINDSNMSFFWQNDDFPSKSNFCVMDCRL